jgi:hypothetical protein
LVSLAMDDHDEHSEEEYVPHAASKKLAVKTSHASHHGPQVKAEQCNKDSLRTKTVTRALKTKVKRLNGNNVQMSDLPEFAREKWRDTFLPTLYDKFFSSDQPFEGFYKDSDKFVALLQGIIEEVYPDIDYEVSSSDSIQLLVRHFTCQHIIPLGPLANFFRHIIGSMKSDPI